MSELELQNKSLKEENMLLKAELAQLKKMIFGSRSERFVPASSPGQGNLFGEDQMLSEQQPVLPAKAPSPKKNKSTATRGPRLNFPSHLPRQEVIIEPQDTDLTDMIRIGEDVTELLAYNPGSVFVYKFIRGRYVSKQDNEKVILQAPIPPRLIPRGMVDESLVAQLITEKILYHTPIYRFRKKLIQDGLDMISEKNLRNWFGTGAESILPLYYLFQEDVLKRPYLQGDETTMPVLSKNKPGSTHRGYLWVVHSPKDRAVVFQYDRSRSQRALEELLPDYKGILQTDGYQVYESLKKKNGYRLVYCMAHARRKFFDAQDTDPPRAECFLQQVGRLYDIEQQARDQGLNEQERLQLRQQQSVPILKEMGDWLKKEYNEGKLLPRHPITQAISYALQRWEGLSAYAEDGRIEIDNNLIENTIRPVALGRKNYLFAGSHKSAQLLACLYSIVGTAEKHGLNVQKYLTWLLKKVATTKVTKDALKWLPHKMDEQQLAKFRI